MRYAETFSEYARIPARALPRRWARSASLWALYAAYLTSGRLTRGLEKPRVQFFCLHHIFQDEEGPFRSLMATLSTYFDFRPWSEGVQMVRDGKQPDRPVACFSSDDGLASNLKLAQILEEFGTTGCFFLNPVSIETRDDAFVERFCLQRLEARPARFLTAQEVDMMLARGHEVGNHTMNHVVCAEKSPDRLAEEIGLAKHDLESRFGPVPHFAWPYGQLHHFSDAARRAVRDAGHLSSASVLRGAHKPANVTGGDEVLYLRRDQMWALNPAEHILYFCARGGNRQYQGNEFVWPEVDELPLSRAA